jgi:hypothetical protein
MVNTESAVKKYIVTLGDAERQQLTGLIYRFYAGGRRPEDR